MILVAVKSPWWSLRSYLNCFTMAFGDCPSRLRFGDYLVHSEIIFSLVRNCLGKCNYTHSALIELTCSQRQLPSALMVVPIIIQVGALLHTLNLRSVLGALIISNCWVHSPGNLRVCFPLFLHLCLVSLVGVCISSFSQFTCCFVSRCTVNSASCILLNRW